MFWQNTAAASALWLHCNSGRPVIAKISLANFSFRATLSARVDRPAFARRAKMAWKAPKIIEVPVGMEINMYACAVRK